MSTKNRAYTVIAAFAALVVVLAVGLYEFSLNGQFQPAALTNNTVKADQHDSVVGSDVKANSLRK